MSGKYIINLPLISECSIGSKAENLNFLLSQGFRVPLTFSITEGAYELFLDMNNLRNELNKIIQSEKSTPAEKSNYIILSFQKAAIPSELTDEILKENIFNNRDYKWAVRSSSNLEDLAGSSFAGLYDSYLNVSGLDNVLISIKKCWASLWNERAIIYREKNKLDHKKGKMAVILQEMVKSEYSGVIFTRHPTSENKDELLIEYCEGLGEDLVSGKVTPYSCDFSRSTQSIRHINEPETKILSDEDIKKLSGIALEVETCSGGPQDIEWAFNGDEYFLLQARPITQPVFGGKNEIDNLWTRANIGEVLPDVITPLTWDIFRCTLFNNPSSVIKPSADNYSLFNNVIRLINGRGYLKLKFFLDSFCYLPYVTPEVMKHVLGVDVVSQTSSYKRPNGIAVKLAQLLFFLDIFKIVPRISILLKRLPDVPSSETGNLEKIIQWNAKCFYLHIKCTAYSIGAFAMLSHYLYKWIPSEAQAMITLILTGNESLQTAEQGMTIWEICNFIRNRPALLDIINKESDWIRLSDEVVKVDGGAECLGMLYEFLQKNGARAAEEFELAVPRWKEAPGFILDVMRSYLAIPVRESNAEDIFARRRNRDKAVNNISRSLSRIQRIIFKKLLSSYADFCTLRENIKYQLMEGYFIIRMNILDIGAQMVLGNILDNKNDIFFMRLSEIKGILKNEKFYCNPKDLISERKAQHKIWKSQHTPDLILQDGMPLQTINDSNSLLKGIGCSPGIVEGYARVLKNISEMRDLKHGEILVTSHTDPGWTPLFLSCKGLVTETGGFLSHGATVAREYGLPAVVSVPSATEKIQTGHYLIVDGNRGLVTITSMK